MSSLNGAGSVRVKRLPQVDEGDNVSNVSNKEVMGDSGEFNKQEFMNVTIGFDDNSGARLDPADSQLYMCEESDGSDDEAEANNVLNELNDFILNEKKKEDFGDLDDLSGMGSIDNDDIYELEPMPQTESMVLDAEGEDERNKVNISRAKISKFEMQQ